MNIQERKESKKIVEELIKKVELFCIERGEVFDAFIFQENRFTGKFKFSDQDFEIVCKSGKKFKVSYSLIDKKVIGVEIRKGIIEIIKGLFIR